MTCHPLLNSKSKFLHLAVTAKGYISIMYPTSSFSTAHGLPLVLTWGSIPQEELGNVWRHFLLSQRLSWEVIVVYLVPQILNFLAGRSLPLCLTQQRIISPKMSRAFLLRNNVAYTDSVTYFLNFCYMLFRLLCLECPFHIFPMSKSSLSFKAYRMSLF